MADLLGDFRYSVAQEDVDFITEIVQTSTPGENYYTGMIFVEKNRFIKDTSAWVPIGSTDYSMIIVTKNNYVDVAQGLLLSWLTDFFSNNTASKVYLIGFVDTVASAGDWTTAKPKLEQAYSLVKTLAYWKTICVADDAAPSKLLEAAAIDYVKINNADLNLLSGPVPLPIQLDAVSPGDLTKVPLYSSLVAGNLDAFVCAHGDSMRNGALFSLGLSMAVVNVTGTPVGNSIDNVKTNLITYSGPSAEPLDTTVQAVVKAANIQYFKPLGNGSNFAVARGQKTLKGNYILANWIVNYCNYINKIRTAETITVRNFYRNSRNYRVILNDMIGRVMPFQTMGRLERVKLTAPDYSVLSKSIEEFVIPNAWEAYFIDDGRYVRVYGTLYIGG